MHRVESGPVVVAIIYSRPRPSKVLVVVVHTQAIALALGTPLIKPRVASPLVQSRSIYLGT